MHHATSLFYTLSLIAVAYGNQGYFGIETFQFPSTCNQIEVAISNSSQVFFPSSPQYLSDISHIYVSSSEDSACSVEPGTAEDVSSILRILGSTRTPFAVKGGGHALNPGFSSTPGIQISMTRFKDIKVDAAAATVEVGAGLTWDVVYAALEPYGVTVVGGRIPGVGVAGLTLGGGFSWKTNQYGLTVDNLVGFEVVLPNGTITSVTADDADLWFALRGGLNNFGIVTKFILKSYPQGEVWGGSIVYPPDQLGALKDAIVRYQEKVDVKATATFSLIYASGDITAVGTLFYDASTPSQGIFDDFLTIPAIHNDLSTRSFSDLVSSLNITNPPSDVPTRAYISGIPVTHYSAVVIDAFVNQMNLWGERLGSLDETLSIVSILEPSDGGILSHGSGTAYPPDRSQTLFPSALLYTWSNVSLDHTFALALRNQSDAVHSAALADGQNLSHAAVYVNYALFDTPLEDMYGENVPRLREIKAEIDPEDVMGLAGGFKL